MTSSRRATSRAQTAFEYVVLRDGEEIGRVRFLGAIGILNSGEDPRGWIAQRLSEVEQNEGFSKLASALGVTLQM
jgi:hypothetical protein